MTYKVKTEPDSGCERFLRIEVCISTEQDNEPNLDNRGQRELNCWRAKHDGFVPYRATGKCEWIDSTAREKCRKSQKKKRWEAVEKSASRMKNQEFPPIDAVFVLGPDDSLLHPIDGARRLMAHAESGQHELQNVVVCKV